MSDDVHSTDGVDQTEEFSCPYPNCDWSPSRPVDSEVPLTQAVVSHEIKDHRSVHSETDQNE